MGKKKVRTPKDKDYWSGDTAIASMDNVPMQASRWEPPSHTVVTTTGGGYHYITSSFDEVVEHFHETAGLDGKIPDVVTFETAGSDNRRVFLFVSQITAIMDISPREESS